MSTPDRATTGRKFVLPNPETFFKAQTRNRRATWRMSALCVFAAFIMGVPLTLVLTPLLYAITLVAADIINYFSPLPAAFWDNASDLAKIAYRAADYLINQRGTLDINELIIAALLMLAPGMLLAFVLWMGMRLLFRHGGVGGTLASLNAREPNQADLKELQLADVVEEMAIAAGLPTPRLMLIDSQGANAAVIGTSAADARIVLSRRLMDDLDRPQLQALLAHLIGSISNGDLRIAFTVTSVFESCGLIIALVNAPFGKQSRRTLWRLLRYALRGGSRDAQLVDAGEVGELLADTLDVKTTDIDRFFSKENPGLIRKLLRLLLYPFLFTNIGVEITLWVFLQILLGPCMALLWRTRRYLADASAVEFTRDPDALATALQSLSEDTNAIPGGEWASHLFVVNPKGDRTLRGVRPQPAQEEKMVGAWQSSATSDGYVPASANAVSGAANTEWWRIRQEMMDTAMAAATGNEAAAARMQRLTSTLGVNPAFGFHHIPDPADFVAAAKGSREAIARIRILQNTRGTESRVESSQTGLQTHSFLSFHPPLNRRAKRLQKMGSRLVAPENHYGVGLKILISVLYIILVPLMVAAAAVTLGAVALIIVFNLLFLGIWLSVVHWAFGQDWSRNFHGFVKFVDDVYTAFSKHR
jgi:Zn-dependent protease with chaperone function